MSHPDPLADRLVIIDKLCEKHPTLGTGKGWAHYTGGMADHGGWHVRRMLEVPTEELRALLDEIEAEERKPKRVMTEEEIADSKVLYDMGDGHWCTKLFYDQMKAHYDKMMGIALGGNPK